MRLYQEVPMGKRANAWTMMAALVGLVAPFSAADVYNLKVVTDANPDYSDLPSLVHSATSRWETPEQKCWAMFYWNHIARRQTNPIVLHGMALTDPIRQFNDYGYTMCSTISGINQSIWAQMGLKHRYWDISNHTVSEVFYDGRWHCYDNSLSALYTLCDGKTIAGVEDIGKEGACQASGGKVAPGHIAKYHCLTATSPRGFLSGADTARSLDEEYRCFNPNGLKLRTYFYDWDYGHRYVLNLREGQTYTRNYNGLGDGPEFYVPNADKDPEKANPRYRLRGNGVWTFKPSVARADWKSFVHSARNIWPGDDGLSPERPPDGEIVYKVNSANVTTGQTIIAKFSVKSASSKATIAVSTDDGLHFKDVWSNDKPGEVAARVPLVAEVNGAYETLIRVTLLDAAVLKSIEVRTNTALNAKTQPRLNLGKNTVYVGAGEQTDSVVLWPELQGDKYRSMIVDEKNVKTTRKHAGYMGTLYPATANEDGYVVYRIDAPRDIVRLTYGGRFYNRAPKSHIDMLHSFDGGKTWKKSWTLTDTAQPWDVIHYETINVPAGVKSVAVKYLMNTTQPEMNGCSIYALRMEANYKPVELPAKPLAVTFAWNEVQKDRSLVKRSHTQVVENWPATYTINVGGEDHPVMDSMSISLATPDTKTGYSDGKDVGGAKWVGQWLTVGKNLAVGKPYTLSQPSQNTWGAGDPNGKKLTDGVAGPSYAGGTSYATGAIWNPRTNPTITLDLGATQTCAAFGMNFHGYPWHDALKGQMKDQVEVLVSDDGKNFQPVGHLKTDLRWKDLPVNHVWTDEETMTGGTFRVIPERPVSARFVQYRIKSDRNFCATELEVLDSIKSELFDLRVALSAQK
jgi:hypothetical protein